MVYIVRRHHGDDCQAVQERTQPGRAAAREFRFDGDRVRVRRAGRGVLVEPMFTDVKAWFAELDRLASEPFMPEGRQQPTTPPRDVFDDDVPA